MDSQFEADTIALGEDMLLLERNSPSNVALSKWFIANDWYNKYKENFSEQAVVNKIMKNDLTAKSVTNMLLGFNAANFKSEAANVVKRCAISSLTKMVNYHHNYKQLRQN